MRVVVLFFVCLFLFLFFPNFGNPAKERYRRYSETAISVNTFIVGLNVFGFFIYLFLIVFFRVTPECALTFLVYENVFHFLLPNR